MGTESLLDRERRIRQKVEAIFNKREEDFASRSEWDNYLEALEDIAFNLIEGIDVAATTERLARYERENAESIVAVAAQQAEAARRTEVASANLAGDAEATSSLTGAAAAAGTQHAEGHTALQYAAAQPGVTDARSAPPPQPAQQSNSVYPDRDPDLSLQQQHVLMAKASGWDPGIVNVRAIQQAYASLQF